MPRYKKYRKRHMAKRKGKPYWNYTQWAMQLALFTKCMLNVEFKHVIGTGTSQAIPTTGIRSLIVNLVEGITDNTRVGAQIKVMSIQLNYILNMSPSATTTLIRIMVVADRQTNQAQFGIQIFSKIHQHFWNTFY